jgi:hypothetical protein
MGLTPQSASHTAESLPERAGQAFPPDMLICLFMRRMEGRRLFRGACGCARTSRPSQLTGGASLGRHAPAGRAGLKGLAPASAEAGGMSVMPFAEDERICRGGEVGPRPRDARRAVEDP